MYKIFMNIYTCVKVKGLSVLLLCRWLTSYDIETVTEFCAPTMVPYFNIITSGCYDLGCYSKLACVDVVIWNIDLVLAHAKRVISIATF